MQANKNILVINSGSSSLKFALMVMPEGRVLMSGLAERLGTDQARIIFQPDHLEVLLANGGLHEDALSEIVARLQRDFSQLHIDAVGHRVVHGGEEFTASCIITSEVEETIENLCQLAPLHNPANLSGIRSAQSIFSSVPHIAVFDTAFHQTLPAEAYTYALPKVLYEQHGIRRYGFHGTSHRYVSAQAKQWLDPAQTKLITVHLGNGCSICAISNGTSLDTSMGLTPLEGLVMGTRCGDLDPSLVFYLVDELGYSMAEVQNMFNKQSGLLGLSARSNDCRELIKARANGDLAARLALDVFCYRVAKYISSYLVPLGGLDALVFTGGIGENAAVIRAMILNRLHFLGITLNQEANDSLISGQAGLISFEKQPAVLVIPTNEERMISVDAYELIHKGSH